ncbi:MAG TPA: thioredoxin-dependent thiol peroxidase [Salinivirgaceae bacterium]|nr:thioredoxin-dependent thiol peroxidase [Salinivirgaceae bacterium]
MNQIKIGDKAPFFQGHDQNGNLIKLNDFLGKRIILYFYPKDNTPGCTAEACNLNDNFQSLTTLGFEIIGVSPDSISSHQKFATKFNLQFHLISDPEKQILKAYNAWGEKKLYGKISEGVLRKTYIIDNNGNIEAIIEKVDTKNHAEQILKNIKTHG